MCICHNKSFLIPALKIFFIYIFSKIEVKKT
jgi:hypothetical protein